MLSDTLADMLKKRNVHYGWVVAIVTFLTMLSTAGVMGSAGIMIEPLHKEFGWSTADISFAMAVRLVLFGLFGPFAAAFMNRYGVRNVVLAALCLILSGIVGALFMTSLAQLILYWGIIIGIGTGMTALVLGATVATRWFSKSRGLVVGMMTASNATGQLIFLPLLAQLSEIYGWRSALAFALCFMVLAMLLVLAFMRDTPASVGLPPYGETEIVPEVAKTQSLGALLLSPLIVLREAASSGTFWILFFTFFVCGLSTNGLIQTHWISICGDFGLMPVGAVGILAMIGLFDFGGTILSGWLSDRYDNRWLLFWYYGLRGLSLIVLAFSSFDLFTLSLFAVFYGLDWVATVPPTVKLSAEHFGREKAGMIFGWVFTGHQLGAATAAFGAGYIRSDYASYMPALYIAGMMCVLAALSIFIIRQNKPVFLTATHA
jgi:sugar phosphate permease